MYRLMQGRFNSRIRSISFVTILLVILFGSWQSQLVSSESELDSRFTSELELKVEVEVGKLELERLNDK